MSRGVEKAMGGWYRNELANIVQFWWILKVNEHSWTKTGDMLQNGQSEKTLIGCDGVNEDQILD